MSNSPCNECPHLRDLLKQCYARCQALERVYDAAQFDALSYTSQQDPEGTLRLIVSREEWELFQEALALAHLQGQQIVGEEDSN